MGMRGGPQTLGSNPEQADRCVPDAGDVYAALLAHAPDPIETLSIAFGGVIAAAYAARQRPLIRGLSEAEFQSLIARYFPGALLDNGADACSSSVVDEEAEDLFALLCEYRCDERPETAWLARAIASAAMRDNHLWQDMGLPDRAFLSALMRDYFPGLSARNGGDMKWKKFFYRQLCERAGVPICKSPHCAECVDFSVCFGPEVGDPLLSGAASSRWPDGRKPAG